MTSQYNHMPVKTLGVEKTVLKSLLFLPPIGYNQARTTFLCSPSPLFCIHSPVRRKGGGSSWGRLLGKEAYRELLLGVAIVCAALALILWPKERQWPL